MTIGDDSTSGDTVVVNATSLKGVTTTFAYEGNTPIQALLNDLTQQTGWDLEPVYMEIDAEIQQRSAGLRGGGKFVIAPKEGKLEFEKVPTDQVKLRAKVIWRKPEK